MNIEQRLRALAADDARVQVPDQVNAAVMAAWDAQHHHEARRRPALSMRVAGLCAAAAAVVFAGISVFVGSQAIREGVRDDARSETPRQITAAATATGDGSRVTLSGEDGSRSAVSRDDVSRLASRAETPRVRSAARARPVSRPAPSLDTPYVLVPDAGMTGAPVAVMRVRMPRGAVGRLGIPLASPDADGMVDVEVLVGHDGVAQSIRRVSTVGDVESR